MDKSENLKTDPIYDKWLFEWKNHHSKGFYCLVPLSIYYIKQDCLTSFGLSVFGFGFEWCKWKEIKYEFREYGVTLYGPSK